MNFAEAQIIALTVRAKAIEVEVIAMQANDKGSAGAYTEGGYLEQATRLHAIHDEIQALAGGGFL